MTKENGNTCWTTPLPRYAVLPPQGGQMTTRGFTLIELLVVVLIISILAAVAVPQYQKAVAKAKLAALIPIMKSVFVANQTYHLENGIYTNDITAWNISLPNVKKIKDMSLTRKQVVFNDGSYLLIQDQSDETGGPFVSGHTPNVPAYLHRFYNPKSSWRCYATEQKGIGICKAFGCAGNVVVYGSGCEIPTM